MMEQAKVKLKCAVCLSTDLKRDAFFSTVLIVHKPCDSEEEDEMLVLCKKCRKLRIEEISTKIKMNVEAEIGRKRMERLNI